MINEKLYKPILVVPAVPNDNGIRFLCQEQQFDINGDMAQFLSEYIEQMETRLKYAEKKGHNLLAMMSYIKYNRATIIFEIIAMRLPEWLFMKAVNAIIRRNM